MLEGVLVDSAVELGFDFAGHFGRSAAAGAVEEAAGAFMSKALHPFCRAELVKWKVSETALTVYPVTTSRTAWARRKTRASLECLIKESEVGRA